MVIGLRLETKQSLSSNHDGSNWNLLWSGLGKCHLLDQDNGNEYRFEKAGQGCIDSLRHSTFATSVSPINWWVYVYQIPRNDWEGATVFRRKFSQSYWISVPSFTDEANPGHATVVNVKLRWRKRERTRERKKPLNFKSLTKDWSHLPLFDCQVLRLWLTERREEGKVKVEGR